MPCSSISDPELVSRRLIFVAYCVLGLHEANLFDMGQKYEGEFTAAEIMEMADAA